MDEEPLGALLKGKDSCQKVERGMLTFQVTHSRSVKWEKNDVGKKKFCGRYRKGVRHPCVGVYPTEYTD